MHRLLFLASAALLSARAQSLVDAAHLAAVRAEFDSAPSPGASLKCRFSSIPPALNFSLRFQTGFSVELPLVQFHGDGHAWETLLRVTPEGRPPVFLTSSESLPQVPDTKAFGEFTGTFVVGEGSYTVDAVLVDDSRRVCTSTWRIQAKSEGAERSLQPSLPPGGVAELASRPAAPARARVPKLGRLTVMLHAASLVPGRAQLQPDDILTLAGSLGSLLEQLPAGSARVVVFSLGQRSVLYQKDDFGASDLDDAAKALSDIQLAVVDYKTLRSSGSPELSTDLLRGELGRPNVPDAAVFLGPYAPSRAPSMANMPPQGSTKLFYLQYRTGRFQMPSPSNFAGARGPGGRGGAANRTGIAPLGPPMFPDAIALLMKTLKGETLVVHTPHEFVGAISRIISRTGSH